MAESREWRSSEVWRRGPGPGVAAGGCGGASRASRPGGGSTTGCALGSALTSNAGACSKRTEWLEVLKRLEGMRSEAREAAQQGWVKGAGVFAPLPPAPSAPRPMHQTTAPPHLQRQWLLRELRPHQRQQLGVDLCSAHLPRSRRNEAHRGSTHSGARGLQQIEQEDFGNMGLVLSSKHAVNQGRSCSNRIVAARQAREVRRTCRRQNCCSLTANVSRKRLRSSPPAQARARNSTASATTEGGAYDWGRG